MDSNPGAYKKKRIPDRVRVEVARRNGAEPGGRHVVACFYCGTLGAVWWPLTSRGRPRAWVSLSGLEYDHRFPEVKGGLSTPENIVLACRPCNRKKKDKVL